MITVSQLRKLEDNCYTSDSKLKADLELLANKASEILGFEVVADICNGSEIEFRELGPDGVPDSSSCILIEDIINKIK